MLFGPSDLTEEELELQREVRAFLAEELAHGTFTPGLAIGARREGDFSTEPNVDAAEPFDGAVGDFLEEI